jgi:hypothetical protein
MTALNGNDAAELAAPQSETHVIRRVRPLDLHHLALHPGAATRKNFSLHHWNQT